jgi:hypothetical protein
MATLFLGGETGARGAVEDVCSGGACAGWDVNGKNGFGETIPKDWRRFAYAGSDLSTEVA